MEMRQLLVDSYLAAVAAADPLRILPRHLPAPPSGKTLVVGAGKAAASMALAVEQHWPPGAALEGVVVTRYRHGLPTKRIRVVEAGHPVPDETGEAAARDILQKAGGLGSGDLLLALVSGGGSALLSLPVDAVGIEALKATTRELLRCGAPIQEMNAVRKHLSSILGGRLAAACKAPVLALLISDVTGDEPTHIASGPCAPDPTTFDDALAVIQRYGVEAPQSVREYLERGARGEVPETPKPGDTIFLRTENRVVATAQQALRAAADFFRQRGITSLILGDSVTGEASEVAKAYGALVRQIARYGDLSKPPLALISGGECTVTVRGRGRGGRCTEFLLSLAVDLAGARNVHAIACDTDGIDGSEDNAGAVLFPESLERGLKAGLRARPLLANNDAYGFFSGLGDLVVTGPTRTNVNDYRAIVIT
jgi:hydroxypyruvate reductase